MFANYPSETVFEDGIRADYPVTEVIASNFDVNVDGLVAPLLCGSGFEWLLQAQQIAKAIHRAQGSPSRLAVFVQGETGRWIVTFSSGRYYGHSWIN